MDEMKPLSSSAKPFAANKNWGMFGYKGYCIDLAIELDDPEAIKEAIRRDWIDKDTGTTFGTPLRTHCLRRGKMKVADALKDAGFPE